MYLVISTSGFLCLYMFLNKKKANNGIFSETGFWKERHILEARHACQCTAAGKL